MCHMQIEIKFVLSAPVSSETVLTQPIATFIIELKGSVCNGPLLKFFKPFCSAEEKKMAARA